MTPTYHPRSTWNHLSPYPVTGPAAVWSNITTAVIHYTGADDLIDGDPGEHADDLPRYLANIQTAYAKPKDQGGRGYSIGYMFAVDWLGGVWQLRGWEYKSAANASHNEYTMPILLLVDGADPATPEAVRAVRWLVAEGGKRAGRDLTVKGHGQLRVETGVGTITACPGVGLQAQVTAGVFTPQPEPDPVPPVEPSTEVDMIVLDWRPNTGQWTAFVTTGPHLAWITDGNADAVFNRAGVARVTVSDAELVGLLKSTTKTSPCPPTLPADMAALWVA